MGKLDGVLLVTDYDDTLYGSDNHVSDENQAAIRRFIAQGGSFTVATGRAHTTFAPQITRERLRLNAPAVLSNGSAVYDFQEDRMLMQTFLPPESGLHLAEVAGVFPALGFEAYHGEDIYVHNPNRVTWSHLRRAGVGHTECPIPQMPLPWTKVLLQQEHGLLLKVRDYFSAHWPEDYEVIFSNHVLLELTAKGSNKGQAVLWVARRLGVDPAHLYCVGDNQNDLPMLAAAAQGFAPANCAQEVKDWGATIVGSCDEHCVAQIIELLEQEYEYRR